MNLKCFLYYYNLYIYSAGYLANRIGGKYLYGGGIFATAVLTLLTPLLAKGGVYVILTVRVLEGLFEVWYNIFV